MIRRNRHFTDYNDALSSLARAVVRSLSGKRYTSVEQMEREVMAFCDRPEYEEVVRHITGKAITGIYKGNVSSWREAARRSMNGSKLLAYLRRELSGSVGDRLREIIVENANLVRTVPLRVATSLVEEIKEGALAGIRPETMVVEFMSRYPNLLKSRVELIARTESSKAQTALTRVRSELMDIHWYTWRTSQDFRVRSSHEHMEDVLVSWIDPPSPEAIIGAVNYGTYHAGDTFNCRCYPEPVIEWKYVKFPHKVYYRNAIRMMTWAQFKRIEDSARYSQAA